MMERLALLSDAAMSWVRLAACLILIFRLLSTERPGRKSAAAVLACGTVVSVALYFAGPGDMVRIALEAVLAAGCARRFQKAGFRMSLFVAAFFEIGVFLWRFLCSAWLGVLFRAPIFLAVDAWQGMLAGWILHLLLGAGAALLWRRKPGEKGKTRTASVIVTAGLLAVISLSEQKVLPIDGDMLEMWTILSVVLMMSVQIFHMNRQYEAEREIARLKSQQAQLLERDYTALSRVYEVNARLFHDLHNHIGALRQLLVHQKAGEALGYLDELQAPVGKVSGTVWTGDEAADYLINTKAAEAEAEGIQYQVQVEFPRNSDLRSADLCAILGNLLDNALEAVRRISERERFISLTVRRINQMLVIKVENSAPPPAAEEDGTLKTVKEQNGLHGWGLKSVQTAAGKYDGLVQTGYSEGVFRAVVTLSFQGVERE